EKFKNLPEPLPYKDADGAIVSLQKCSIEQVKSLFCRIELPSEKWKDHRPFPAQPKDFVTLGQFYEAIWQVFDKLGEDIVLPDTVQYGLPIYQTGGGRLWEVDSLQKALDLITQNQLQTASNDISHEEPWGPNGMKEKAHYYKFLDIANGIIPIGDTYNMLPNCKPADIKEELPSDLNLLFDYGFSIIVDSIEQLYGKQADINCFFGMAMTAMNKIMKPLAYLMMQIPIDNNGYQDFVAGPSFIYYHIRNPDDEQGNQPYIKATRLARKLLDGNHYPCGTPEFKMLTTAYDGFQTITPYLLDYE
ncbi:MAG: hypothetical protein HN826_06430, partial [Methylococcales bacterium]|nr:hypothetical protein [Methylococcales bacterium]